MDPELLYRIGFAAIALTVLLTVLTGILWWIRWFAVRRFYPNETTLNFTGDQSRQLLTRCEQPKPCWSVAEALLMFGLTLFVSGYLASLMIPVEKNVEPAGDPTLVVLQEAAPSPIDTESPQPNLESNPGNASETQDPGAIDAKQDSADKGASGDKTQDAKKLKIPIQKQIQIHFFATTFALSATLLYLFVLRGASPKRLGMLPSIRDIYQGLVATPWILAPVLSINFVVAILVKYEHAVTNALADANNVSTFLFLFVSAALVTPIAEELQFRLLLQGGLQRIADFVDDNNDPTFRPQSIWPVIATSLIFASMHYGQGAAPIPLFFFSLGLGFLYQATGRLAPVILVHMLLNGATLCLEFCRINSGFPTPGT